MDADTDDRGAGHPVPLDPGDLTGLDHSAVAFTRTVDALTAEQFAAPSRLPGWSRAHVVAHVALNGLAVARVLDGLVHGNPVSMYESDEQRDVQIEELAAASPTELRDLHLAATTAFGEAVERMDDEHWPGRVERLPGGHSWPARTVVPTRRRELEIHHADLGAGYSRADWPPDFAAELLDTVTVDQAPSGPFTVRATDLGRDWYVGGEGGLVVTGSAADLGWWLTRRGDGEGLACESDDRLPGLGPWRRAVTSPSSPARP